MSWVPFFESTLCEVLIRISSVPASVDVFEEKTWGNLGNTGESGFLRKDVLWKPGKYNIRVEKGTNNQRKSFIIDIDPYTLWWEVNLLSNE